MLDDSVQSAYVYSHRLTNVPFLQPSQVFTSSDRVSVINAQKQGRRQSDRWTCCMEAVSQGHYLGCKLPTDQYPGLGPCLRFLMFSRNVKKRDFIEMTFSENFKVLIIFDDFMISILLLWSKMCIYTHIWCIDVISLYHAHVCVCLHMYDQGYRSMIMYRVCGDGYLRMCMYVYVCIWIYVLMYVR